MTIAVLETFYNAIVTKRKNECSNNGACSWSTRCVYYDINEYLRIYTLLWFLCQN